MIFRPHSEQQQLALQSDKPIILLATGIQYGKTTVGNIKMRLALHRFTDPADNFIVTAPTYKILKQSTLPDFKRVMTGLGDYKEGDAVFVTNWGTNVYFRTGTDPDSVVGITNVRFIYGDEAGLYSLYFWENIQARAAFKNAQIILTTSPYSLNWVYKEIIRPKLRDPNARPDVDYFKARSVDNPFFPRDYYERMRETMDPRRFRMMFGGEWEKMSGLVYDCFDDAANMCQPFSFPAGTQFYAGVDWGTTAPFVIAIRALTPDGNHYQPTEVYLTGQTPSDMIALARQKMQQYPIKAFFCDPSGKGMIEEFNKAGIPAIASENDLKVGIGAHYELCKMRKYKLFYGDNKHTIDEYETYHYPEPGEIKPDDNVEDDEPVKQGDHSMDANRYVTMGILNGLHHQIPRVIVPDDSRKLTLDERIRRAKQLPVYEGW